MTKQLINIIATSIILVLAQALVLNRMCLFGVAVPFAFVYVLVTAPLSLGREALFTVAFALGLCVDILSDTHGMNALACTAVMALRRPILRIYFPRESELSSQVPDIKSLGLTTFTKYTLTMSLLYCSIIFTIDALTFFLPSHLILRIIFSTLFTTLVIEGIASITHGSREKRL